MKVYALAPGEDWIVDRFVKEWNEDNADISTTNIYEADVMWLLADWCFLALASNGHLNNKKVLTTVHHIVPSKFNARAQHEFKVRDGYTSMYHVYNKRTEHMVKTLTSKPVQLVPYWANNKIWKETVGKERARAIHGLPQKPTYLIGSFQRDTEGHDLASPKLEKGPDLFVDAVIEYERRCKPYFPVEVVLAGWRRQYVMKRLDEVGIRYHYFERPSQQIVNELYQALDLYPVTARYEGGPQALIECGLLNVPVVSTPVGIAEQVLHSHAICDNVTQASPEIPRVENMVLPGGYQPYRDLLEHVANM